MVSQTGGPIRAIQDWHRSALANSPVKYHQAVDTLMQDFQMLAALDNVSILGEEKCDKDLRPGEVMVPQLGSLLTTKEGFQVTVIGSPESGPRNVRTHNINATTGTITVVQEICRPESDHGCVERYTLDTENEQVLDFKRTPKFWS